MYKSLTLATLLLPIFGYGIDKEARIKELKRARYKKMTEISALRKTILDAHQGIQSSKHAYSDALLDSTNEEKAKLGSADQESIRQQLSESNYHIVDDFFEAFLGKKEFNHSLFHEMYGIEKTGPITLDTLESIDFFHYDKFISFSTGLEEIFEMFTIIKYGQCVKELLAINNEIIKLEK